MDFNSEDFKKLKYDPYNLAASKSAAKQYPELGKRESFSSVNRIDAGVTKDSVVRYILFLYQKGSPLLEIRDHTRRKIEAAKLAGFTMREDGKDFEENYKKIMFCKNDVSNKMIIDFCRIQNDHAFSSYVLYNEIYHTQFEWTLNNDEPRNVKWAVENTKKISEYLKELRKEILMDEDSDGAFRTMLEMVEMEEVHLRREDIAESLAKGEDPVKGFAPYGEGYDFPVNQDINEEEHNKRKDMDE